MCYLTSIKFHVIADVITDMTLVISDLACRSAPCDITPTSMCGVRVYATNFILHQWHLSLVILISTEFVENFSFLIDLEFFSTDLTVKTFFFPYSENVLARKELNGIIIIVGANNWEMIIAPFYESTMYKKYVRTGQYFREIWTYTYETCKPTF